VSSCYGILLVRVLADWIDSRGPSAFGLEAGRTTRIEQKTLLSPLAWLLVAACAWAQGVIRGRVVGVTDGGTIKVLTAEKQLLRVRVAWIDAPESSQAFGQRAKQAMSALVFGKDVELRFHSVDRYSRRVSMA
jgi:endonuclease YncB( thermonuclease family)